VHCLVDCRKSTEEASQNCPKQSQGVSVTCG
jgi:hypothetical protein